MATTKPTKHPFRIIVRGTKGGKRVRAVQTFHAPNIEAVFAHVAKQGDKLAKDVGLPKADFVNVFPPIPSYCTKHGLRNFQ
jgi:hypothetical protein